jgi:hypothetical protein
MLYRRMRLVVHLAVMAVNYCGTGIPQELGISESFGWNSEFWTEMGARGSSTLQTGEWTGGLAVKSPPRH